MRNVNEDWCPDLPEEKKVVVNDSVDDLMSVMQDLNIDIKTKKNNNILIVQNVSIKQEDPAELYIKIIKEIQRVGGIKQFLSNVYNHFLEYFGSALTASRALGVSVRTLQNYNKNGVKNGNGVKRLG